MVFLDELHEELMSFSLYQGSVRIGFGYPIGADPTQSQDSHSWDMKWCLHVKGHEEWSS